MTAGDLVPPEPSQSDCELMPPANMTYNIINMSVGVAGRNYSHTHMYQWVYTFSKLHIKPFSH